MNLLADFPPGFLVCFKTQFPCSAQCTEEKVFVGCFKAHVSGAIASPTSRHRDEDLRLLSHKGCLLLRVQHQVAVAFGFGSESGKDAAADAEVRCAHVCALFGALKAQGNAAKI